MNTIKSIAAIAAIAVSLKMATIYKKVGRRYVEVGEFDDEFSHYPHGSHLVICKPGSTLTRYNIDPAHAAVDAALERVRDALAEAMREATYLTPEKRPYTKKELAGMAAYTAIVGKTQGMRFTGVCMHGVIDEAIKIIAAQAVKTGAEA